jgi:hypothetical protein
MISTEQANKMVEEKMARETPKPEEPSAEKPSTTGAEEAPKQEEPKQEQPKAEEQKDDKPKAEEPKEDKPKDDNPAEDKPKEETPSEDKKKNVPPSKKYSRDERIAHSFAIEKRKRQEAQAKVKELEAELAKVKGLKPEDFNNDVEAYTSYRLDEQHKRDEIERQKSFIEQSEADEMARETERKVSMCFPDEADREEYEQLISTNGKSFYEALQANDPNGVVLDYLNGVEKYPIVLRKLMTDMDALRYVFRDKDPYELRHNLHVFTKELLSGKTEEKKEDVKQPEQEKPQPKPAIPVIGKQVTAQAKPTEPVHDRAYWNDYLLKHKHG